MGRSYLVETGFLSPTLCLEVLRKEEVRARSFRELCSAWREAYGSTVPVGVVYWAWK